MSFAVPSEFPLSPIPYGCGMQPFCDVEPPEVEQNNGLQNESFPPFEDIAKNNFVGENYTINIEVDGPVLRYQWLRPANTIVLPDSNIACLPGEFATIDCYGGLTNGGYEPSEEVQRVCAEILGVPLSTVVKFFHEETDCGQKERIAPNGSGNPKCFLIGDYWNEKSTSKHDSSEADLDHLKLSHFFVVATTKGVVVFDYTRTQFCSEAIAKLLGEEGKAIPTFIRDPDTADPYKLGLYCISAALTDTLKRIVDLEERLVTLKVGTNDPIPKMEARSVILDEIEHFITAFDFANTTLDSNISKLGVFVEKVLPTVLKELEIPSHPDQPFDRFQIEKDTIFKWEEIFKSRIGRFKAANRNLSDIRNKNEASLRDAKDKEENRKKEIIQTKQTKLLGILQGTTVFFGIVQTFYVAHTFAIEHEWDLFKITGFVACLATGAVTTALRRNHSLRDEEDEMNSKTWLQQKLDFGRFGFWKNNK